MTSASNNISDKDILYMLAEKRPQAWEYLYNKYAPAMYGMIHNLAGEKLLAEKILIAAFVHLKKEWNFLKITNALCVRLLRYTYDFAIRQLKNYGIHPGESNRKVNAEVIDLLCSKCSSINEVASHLNSTTQEATKKLQTEFYSLRSQHGNKPYHINDKNVFVQVDTLNDNTNN